MRERIAEEVRALMGRRRMRDGELARVIGRSHTYMYRRLSGETAFDADDLEMIARALGVNVVDLLPRDEREVTVRYPDEPVTGREPVRNLPRSPLAVTYPTGGRPPTRRLAQTAQSSRRTRPTGR